MTFIGILLAALCNFGLGILGYTIAFKSTFLVNTFQLVHVELTSDDYFFSFSLKLLVIAALTWILNKVMPLLDKPRKRVLFIFLLGTIFSFYNEINIFLRIYHILLDFYDLWSINSDLSDKLPIQFN